MLLNNEYVQEPEECRKKQQNVRVVVLLKIQLRGGEQK